MDYKDLTEEQKAKARNCKTPEDVLKLAHEEGYEITDEELEGVAGGSVWSTCDSPYYCDADAGCIGRIR